MPALTVFQDGIRQVTADNIIGIEMRADIQIRNRQPEQQSAIYPDLPSVKLRFIFIFIASSIANAPVFVGHRLEAYVIDESMPCRSDKQKAICAKLVVAGDGSIDI